MGGKGAKERRRLQRLGVTGAEGSLMSKKESKDGKKKGKSLAQPSRGSNKSPERHSSSKSSRGKPTNQKSKPGNNFQNPKRSTPSSRHPHAKPANTKPKVKKPKHLKRKLDQLEEENNEERDRLTKELADFKQRKSKLSTRDPRVPNTKRMRVPVDRSVVSRQPDRSAEKTPETLPRSEKIETTIQTIPVATMVTSSTHAAVKDDSDSESDVSLDELVTTRQRGRRRRGRQETSKKEDEEALRTEVKESSHAPQNGTTSKPGVEPAIQDAQRISSSNTRRCIGRKPVTDFAVGERYPGKVVYIKAFGAFIDIGCHSDAFCHVSRVRDDFVKNIGDAVNEGDIVNPRVVEISRKDKRITVSLQSDARMDDERASAEAWEERKGKRGKTQPYNNKVDDQEHVRKRADNRLSDGSTERKAELPIAKPLDEASMSPAELKRARKLARRAARRSQQEQTGISA